jgi:hypothetical protein
MEDKIQPKLSVEYIISKLQGLDFNRNNIAVIQPLAESLGLDNATVTIIYKIFRINSMLDKEGVRSDLRVLNGAITSMLSEYRASRLRPSQVENRRKIQPEIDDLLEELRIKLTYFSSQNGGFARLLKDRFKGTGSKEKNRAIDHVLLRYYRREVEEYLAQKKADSKLQIRVNILTKLLADNPSSEEAIKPKTFILKNPDDNQQASSVLEASIAKYSVF